MKNRLKLFDKICIFMGVFCALGTLIFGKTIPVHAENISVSENVIIEELEENIFEQEPTSKDFVARMYRVALNREPEEAGLDYWTSQLENMTSDGATLARGFIGSAEFAKRNLSNEDFVDTLYKTFFDRQPDLDGRNFWLGKLNSGVGRMEVLSGFVNSREFGNLCSHYGIARGTMEKDGSNIFNKGIYQFVCRNYTEILQREGEIEGIEYWTYLLLKDKISAFSCAEGFLHSSEFLMKNVSDEEYVKILYRTFLDREAEEEGKKYWMQELKNGKSRDDIIRGFSGSKEFRLILKRYGMQDNSSVLESIPFTDNSKCAKSGFRIPAIVSLSDGSIVAAADARWNTNRDGGGSDTVVSISRDDGESWTTSFANYLGDNGDCYNIYSTAFIDPSMATDGNTIYLMVDLFPGGYSFAAHGQKMPEKETGVDAKGRLYLKKQYESSYNYVLDGGNIYTTSGQLVQGYSVDPYFNISYNGRTSNLFYSVSAPFSVYPSQYLYLTRSTDGGKTWSVPSLITAKTPGEDGYSVAGGNGLIMSDGTIIFPCFSTEGYVQNASFIYSMDGGSTFRRTEDATDCLTSSSESTIVELDPMTVRMFYRDGSSDLKYADYYRGNGDFIKSKDGIVEGAIKTKFNQMSAIRYDANTFLLSCAGSGTEEREQGTIIVINMDSSYQMSVRNVYHVNGNGYYGYSSLTKLKDGAIGLLYEYYSGTTTTKIKYQRIPKSFLGL